jgi:hypothetical protein
MSEFDDLRDLQKNKPEELKELFRRDPALRKRILEWGEYIEGGEKVSAGGFALFYKLLFDRFLPKVMEPVAEEFAWAYQNRKGVVLEGWRGFGKSTFFTGWGPYVMGVNPVGSTALIRINDGKAKEMGKAISDIIMTNPAWKMMFPHVAPDERAGWSVENGFNVMDLRITGDPGSAGFEEGYSKWLMMCLADHLSEKSLVCNGVESGSNIGLHPTNGEWFDDLHDERNTQSTSEMQRVVKIIEANFVPTWFSAGGSPTIGVFCTPWSKNPPDAYQSMLKTGMFRHLKIPIFKLDEEGEVFPPTGEKVKLTWPELFPMERVVEIHKAAGTRFGQMYLLNVELSKPKNIKYTDFPEEDIKVEIWPMIAGVDPVAWVRGISTGEGVSHFAAAQFLKTPYNFLVVYDGIIERCDAQQGEKYIADMQRTYYRTFEGASIEKNGAGAIFIALLNRTTGIKYHGHDVRELGLGKKKDRQYRFLQPLFASGAIKVSTAKTPFLDAVREYLDIFPNFEEDSYLADVGDALAIGALDVPEIWTSRIVDSAKGDLWAQKKPKADPYKSLSNWSYLK